MGSILRYAGYGLSRVIAKITPYRPESRAETGPSKYLNIVLAVGVLLLAVLAVVIAIALSPKEGISLPLVVAVAVLAFVLFRAGGWLLANLFFNKGLTK